MHLQGGTPPSYKKPTGARVALRKRPENAKADLHPHYELSTSSPFLQIAQGPCKQPGTIHRREPRTEKPGGGGRRARLAACARRARRGPRQAPPAVPRPSRCPRPLPRTSPGPTLPHQAPPPPPPAQRPPPAEAGPPPREAGAAGSHSPSSSRPPLLLPTVGSRRTVPGRER